MIDGVLRSTTAVTMAKGSSQANILPELATATINCRPLQGDTIETMQAHFESLMPEGVKVRFWMAATLLPFLPRNPELTS